MLKNIILVDWFAMTFREPSTTPFDVISTIGLARPDITFIDMPGRYHYRNRLSFGNIHILYNSIKPDSDYPMLEMSGQGCREFETFSSIDFDYLFDLARDTKNYHMVRLDVAYDDRSGVFDIKQIVSDFYNRNYVSSSSRGNFTDDVRRNVDGWSVTTGSKSSDMYMRIYDKAVERGFYDGRHWVRCELVLKQERAVNFVLNREELGIKFLGVIKNYFRFVTPCKNDTNKRRWKTRPYWRDFLGDVERISVFTKEDIEYNFSRLQRYVLGQAGNSVDTYIRCVGLPKFLDDLLNRDSKLTPKQKYVIEQAKLLFEQGAPITEEILSEIQGNYTQ